MSTYFFKIFNVLLNGAVKARGVGVSERKEEPLIYLARPNPSLLIARKSQAKL